MITKEQAWAELHKLLMESDNDTCPPIPADVVLAQLHEMFKPENIFYLTGDKHGDFNPIKSFCKDREMERENTFIILGDTGLNFYLDRRDHWKKETLARLAPTFFCIHGNHEARPSAELGYHETVYHDGRVMVQDEYPNILFPIDGEVFDFCGHSCLVIGGAYSVDKDTRLAHGWPWFPDEQPCLETKDRVEQVLADRNWQVDVVFSHTCPRKYEPIESFLPGIDQSKVDKSTEDWLGEIEQKLSYQRWYCGHYHISKKINNIQFMFQDFALLPHTHLSIDAEQELIAKIERQAEMVQALEWTES